MLIKTYKIILGKLSSNGFGISKSKNRLSNFKRNSCKNAKSIFIQELEKYFLLSQLQIIR